jgi:prevent-host-death family protein
VEGVVQVFGAFDAKNRLGHLLDLVEQGEDVVITRHGHEVARLVPAAPRHDKAAARAAMARIRARAEALGGGPFDWEEWKSYRDEGRP